MADRRRKKQRNPEQIFGALVALWKSMERESTAEMPRTYPFGAHLGHEPAGELTTVGLGAAAMEAYRQLLGDLHVATQWGRRGGWERLRRMVQRFLLEMAVDDGGGRNAIQRRYREMFDAELGGPVTRWRVLLRVPVAMKHFKEADLAGVRFRAMSQEGRNELLGEIRGLLGPPHNGDPNLEKWLGFDQLASRDVVAIADVSERTFETATITAHEYIEDRLDCLSGVSALLRAPSAKHHDPRSRRGPGLTLDLKGRSGRGHLQPYDASDVDIAIVAESVAHPTVRQLLRMIEDRQDRDGTVRLVSCLRWLGRSRRARTEMQAYVSATIALETLLGGDRKLGIGRGLSLRTAHLIGTGKGTRKSLLEHIVATYEKRSHLVHGNMDSIDLDEILSLWILLNRCILAFVKRRFHTKSDAWIEEWFQSRLL